MDERNQSPFQILLASPRMYCMLAVKECRVDYTVPLFLKTTQAKSVRLAKMTQRFGHTPSTLGPSSLNPGANWGVPHLHTACIANFTYVFGKTHRETFWPLNLSPSCLMYSMSGMRGLSRPSRGWSPPRAFLSATPLSSNHNDAIQKEG